MTKIYKKVPKKAQKKRFSPIMGTKCCFLSMGTLNSLCSYLRFEHMKHKGIKTEKLEHYLDLFIYRCFHVRNGSLGKTVEELFNRASGTKKSHKYRETFSKTAKWLFSSSYFCTDRREKRYLEIVFKRE